ncbi:MAG: glycosyltransferase [Chloroflexi bacterium]|nr:glycosyltransferase [Chloroflexota bacterium]
MTPAKPIESVAIISMHTSPLAVLGGYKTGGMNVYVRELSRELGRRGVQVDVFTRRESASQPEVDTSLGATVRVIRLRAGGYGTADPSSLIGATQEFAAGIHKYATLNNRTYDVMYAHYWLSGLVADVLRRSWDVPWVQMFHTLGAMKNRIANQPMIDPRVMAEMQIVRHADRVIAATQAEHHQLLWLYRVDRRKVSIVPPGVDTSQFKPMNRDVARASVGLCDGEKMLLFVGRLEPLKAVDILLRALHELHTVEPSVLAGVRLMVVGGEAGNPERTRLCSLAEQLGVDGYVQFAGSKEHASLPVFYAAAEALIMPSDYESFGMVALEAMASGTPVIASAVGGLQYLIRDGETGFLVPVRDPESLAERIRQMLIDPNLRDTLARAAADRAVQYDWKLVVDQVIEVFERAARGGRRHLNV